MSINPQPQVKISKQALEKFTKTRLKYMRSYYLATPLFMVLDMGFHFNIRVPFLDAYPIWKLLYYCACGLIAYVAFFKVQFFAALAVVESGLNVLCLTLSLIVTNLRYGLDPYGASQPLGLTQMIANIVLVGANVYCNPYLSRSSGSQSSCRR